LSYMVSNLDLTTSFLELRGNKRFGTTMLSLSETLETEENANFSIHAAYEAQLGLNNIFVLTGYQTASASEALINCLDAYIDVVTIGQTTLGKDVGSVTIESLN